MINRALALLNKAIPVGIAAKGLGKVDKRFDGFISSALSAGYTMNAALDFIRDKVGGSEKNRLESREKNLRPDEAASLAGIRQSEEPGKILQKGAVIGAGLLSGGLAGAAANVIPEMIQPTSEPEEPEDPRVAALKRFRQMQMQRDRPEPTEPQQSQMRGQNPADAALLAAMQKILKM